VGRLLAALVAVAAGVACAGGAAARGANDPPRFVPWKSVGDMTLGEPRARVEADYGALGRYPVVQRYGNTVEGFYQLGGHALGVTFYGARVGELGFSTPYYRTPSGFAVGSTIPLGPCHRTPASRCEHRWHGFVYNGFWKETPCGCWVKVGLGRSRSR
jgi:hypothetical protein